MRVNKHFRTILSASLLLACSVQAQEEGVDYGGPEGLDIYEELVDEGAAVAEGLVWDVNDSLTFIPGYDMYCQWNTDVLFNHSGQKQMGPDTLQLHLGYSDCDHAMPCAGEQTSGFGMRRGRMHYGLDLDLETGDPVVSAFAGMVRISKYNSSFGNVVVVRHYNGLETLYAHLSKRHVEPGTLVEAGDTLGLGGNTGRSYGSHLHFEVRFLDEPIDPALVFNVEDGALKSNTFDIHKGTFARIAANRAAQKVSVGSRKFYVVRRGDTLSGIARNTGVKVRELCSINGITERSILSIGQRVRYK